MTKLPIIGVIPARGGSKGVPRKNIRLLAGKPLLAYTIETALAATALSRVIVSTEDREIADIAQSCGAEVPFLRPEDLARDESPTLPVLQHAVREIEADNERCAAVCLLQATTPFRPVRWIDGCVARFRRRGADAVVTVLPVPHQYNPHWVFEEGTENRLSLATGEAEPIPRRQSLPPAWHREGSVYVVSRDCLMERDSLYGDHLVGYRVRPGQSTNIDTMADWEAAEKRMRTR